ncbi:abfB [Symbiodinium natans]|uniref:AbfB protein n=1 Tax=Symbiodinium natans TaxID=878477 RepID=A0A812VF21_9DINO|nr:abfB [Symbiodinium natans]
MALAAPAWSTSTKAAIAPPRNTAQPEASDFSSTLAKACKASVPLASLGLASRGHRRARVARAGAPPTPIWQTKRRLMVAQLERQWRLPVEEAGADAQKSQEPQELPQAFLRFLGGGVLMAVLAQASFLGRRGPDLPSGPDIPSQV